MELNNSKKASYEPKIIFVRLTPEMYEELERLRVRLGARGIATVIKRILETALAEGISVRDGQRTRAKPKAAAIDGDAGEEP